MGKYIITEMTGLDVAKMCGCEDIYLKNVQSDEENIAKRQEFQESFKRMFDKIDRKPNKKDKNLV